MTVPGEQLKRLCGVLVAAFPDERSLAAMVLFELGENLNVIASASGNLADRAFELIRWCQAHGRLDDLVRGARVQRPDHVEVAAVYNAWAFTPAKGLEDPTRLAKGQRVGGVNVYTVQELLGCGAMGVVYRALDANGKSRALKLLLGRAMRDPQALERIKREATIGGRFSLEVSGHVVDVLDVGFDPKVGVGGCAYLAMELLQGETLAARVTRRGRLSPAEAITFAGQLAQVLHEAGQAELRVVHCDLKPENLFFARMPGGVEALKVLDFGIAQTLRERTIGQAFRLTGTPLFAAPEQWNPDAPLTPSADLWAFGLIVFYALTGGYYWSSALLPGLMEEIHLRAYPAASARAAALGVTLPESFDAWFERCVCMDVAGRYADAQEAIDALREEVCWPGDRASPLPGPREPPAPLVVSAAATSRAATAPEERGQGLDERVAKRGPLSLPDTVAVLQQVAAWLAVHREVSSVRGHLEPSRVRLLEGGDVRVLGLEAATVTDARGGAGGTRTLLAGAPGVGYVPSALRARGEVDDLWALARVAFFALTGEPYVRGVSVRAALEEADRNDAPSAQNQRLPEGFDSWFLRCSGGRGEARFADVQAAVEALSQLSPGAMKVPLLAMRSAKVAMVVGGLVVSAFVIAGIARTIDLARATDGAPDGSRTQRDASVRVVQRAELDAGRTTLSVRLGHVDATAEASGAEGSTNPFVALGVHDLAVQEHEVTRREFLPWLERVHPEQAVLGGDLDLPVVEVSRAQASEYCASLSGARLPTRTEWLRALGPVGRAGAAVVPASALMRGGSSEFDEVPITETESLYDLVANVNEWTTEGAEDRPVAMGAFWGEARESVAEYLRSGSFELQATGHTGFRCVRSP